MLQKSLNTQTRSTVGPPCMQLNSQGATQNPRALPITPRASATYLASTHIVKYAPAPVPVSTQPRMRTHAPFINCLSSRFYQVRQRNMACQTTTVRNLSADKPTLVENVGRTNVRDTAKREDMCQLQRSSDGHSPAPIQLLDVISSGPMKPHSPIRRGIWMTPFRYCGAQLTIAVCTVV